MHPVYALQHARGRDAARGGRVAERPDVGRRVEVEQELGGPGVGVGDVAVGGQGAGGGERQHGGGGGVGDEIDDLVVGAVAGVRNLDVEAVDGEAVGVITAADGLEGKAAALGRGGGRGGGDGHDGGESDGDGGGGRGRGGLRGSDANAGARAQVAGCTGAGGGIGRDAGRRHGHLPADDREVGVSDKSGGVVALLQRGGRAGWGRNGGGGRGCDGDGYCDEGGGRGGDRAGDDKVSRRRY